MTKGFRKGIALCISMVLFTACLCTAPVAAPEEHVLNGTFDTPFQVETPEWEPSSVAVSNYITRETQGENGYIKIDFSGLDDATAKSGALVQKLEYGACTIQTNQSYKLSFQAKADQAVSPYVYMRVKNNDGLTASKEYKALELCKTDAWTTYDVYFTTQVDTWADTSTVILSEIKLKAAASNPLVPIYYDNVSITEGVEPVVRNNYISNGTFDVDATGWAASTAIISSYLSWDQTGGVNGTGALKLDFSNAAADAFSTANPDGSSYRNAAYVWKVLNTYALPIDKSYRLTFSVKADTAVQPKIAVRNKGLNYDVTTTYYDNIFAESKDGEWTTYCIAFHTFLEAGKTITQTEVKLCLDSKNYYTPIWYDNISVVEDYTACTFYDKNENTVDSLPNDGIITAKYHYVNTGAETKNASCYLAVYTVKNNAKQLAAISVNSADINVHEAANLTNTLYIPSYSTDTRYIVKAFLWDNILIEPIEKTVFFGA